MFVYSSVTNHIMIMTPLMLLRQSLIEIFLSFLNFSWWIDVGVEGITDDLGPDYSQLY